MRWSIHIERPLWIWSRVVANHLPQQSALLHAQHMAKPAQGGGLGVGGVGDYAKALLAVLVMSAPVSDVERSE